jgi:hypothetical protein
MKIIVLALLMMLLFAGALAVRRWRVESFLRAFVNFAGNRSLPLFLCRLTTL